MISAGMCSVAVVIARELRQQVIQVPPAEHDEPRKTLGFDRANEFLASTVEIRRSNWQRVRLQATLLQQLGESSGVLHISVVKQDRWLRRA